MNADNRSTVGEKRRFGGDSGRLDLDVAQVELGRAFGEVQQLNTDDLPLRCAAPPVARTPPLMGNRDNNNGVRILPIDNCVWKAGDNSSSMRGSDRRARFRILTDQGDGALDFRSKGLSKPLHA